MLTRREEQAIARDLHLCDVLDIIGSKAAKRRAKAQRRAIFDALSADTARNAPETAAMDDETLLRELGIAL